jgi:hypothetical protein
MGKESALEAICITESKSVKSSGGVVYAITLAAGSDTATVTLYDNASAGSGEREYFATAVTLTSHSSDFNEHPLMFTKGIYATVTGTSPHVTIQYA